MPWSTRPAKRQGLKRQGWESPEQMVGVSSLHTEVSLSPGNTQGHDLHIAKHLFDRFVFNIPLTMPASRIPAFLYSLSLKCPESILIARSLEPRSGHASLPHLAGLRSHCQPWAPQPSRSGCRRVSPLPRHKSLGGAPSYF